MSDEGRIRLAHLPTPLEPLAALSASLGGPEIWVKRDDCTGLASGGNKARKLEHLMHDALAKGADTIITAGGIQSNHARQTAAAAARLDLRCILVLTDSVPGRSHVYHHGGNVLLDRLFGAEIRLVAGRCRPAGRDGRCRGQCSGAGAKPYCIPVGGSNAIGARAYVDAAGEMLDQSKLAGMDFSHVSADGQRRNPCGSRRRTGHPRRTRRRDRYQRKPASRGGGRAGVRSHPRNILRSWASVDAVPEIRIDDRFIGEGYGIPTTAMAEAVRRVARTEGLLLDPVYTGKAMAGLIALVAEGRLTKADRVLFWHTGGSVALFAYEDVFAG